MPPRIPQCQQQEEAVITCAGLEKRPFPLFIIIFNQQFYFPITILCCHPHKMWISESPAVSEDTPACPSTPTSLYSSHSDCRARKFSHIFYSKCMNVHYLCFQWICYMTGHVTVDCSVHRLNLKTLPPASPCQHHYTTTNAFSGFNPPYIWRKVKIASHSFNGIWPLPVNSSFLFLIAFKNNSNISFQTCFMQNCWWGWNGGGCVMHPQWCHLLLFYIVIFQLFDSKHELINISISYSGESCLLV